MTTSLLLKFRETLRSGALKAHWPRRTTVIVVMGFLAIAAVCAALLTATLAKLYADAIDRSKRESAEFSAVLAGQTSRSVEAINLMLGELAHHVVERASEQGDAPDQFGDEETHLYLKQRLSRLPFADVITIVDTNGRVVSSSRAWPTPAIDISDRDHFKAVEAGAKALVISSPVPNRTAGDVLVFFAHRVESSSGTFLGAVVAGAKPDKLIDANAAAAHVQGRTLVLVRRDGVLLAHSESPKSAGSRFPPSSPWFDLVAKGGGDYRSPGYFDGIARQIVVRPLTHWPLVVNVSEREDAALKTWHQVRRTIMLGGAVAAFIGLCLVAALLLNLRRLAAAQRSLWKQAHEDALTVLPNRRHLTEHLDRLLCRASHAQGAIFFVDLDRFKAVNDSLGHAVGDGLLQQVAARLSALVRKSDVVARMGGDEFVMVVDGADAASATTLAERIIADIGQPFNLADGHQANIGASVGIRLILEASASGEQLIDDADRALYQAKLSGRGRACFYKPEMKAAAREKLILDARMRLALERGEFRLLYQPVVALPDRRIVGVEALVRWNDPTTGVVLPRAFIALAEETGFIEPLSHWILDTAITQLAAWHAEGLELDTMAVNLSCRQFKSDDLVRNLQALITGHAIPARCITLEITESMAMGNEAEAEARLSELRHLGFSIALDDFGTGHSSLSVLRSLAIDQLKIDRSLVAGLLNDAVARNLTSSVISLAKTLNLAVVVEGIESEGQLEILEALGCDFAQGYLLGRPMSADDVVSVLQAQHERSREVA
jgi:diguanylate cyclase (GGDEF)-like protein